MKNRELKNSRGVEQLPLEEKQLSDEELKTVDGGFNIIIKDKLNRLRPFLELIFKIKK